MPFTKDQTWRIIKALKLPQSSEIDVQQCLDSTQQRSELLVEQCLDILSQIEQAFLAKQTASTEEAGITKLDIVEYSQNRTIVIRQQIKDLRKDLANLIGYSKHQSSTPFFF